MTLFETLTLLRPKTETGRAAIGDEAGPRAAPGFEAMLEALETPTVPAAPGAGDDDAAALALPGQADPGRVQSGSDEADASLRDLIALAAPVPAAPPPAPLPEAALSAVVQRAAARAGAPVADSSAPAPRIAIVGIETHFAPVQPRALPGAERPAAAPAAPRATAVPDMNATADAFTAAAVAPVSEDAALAAPVPRTIGQPGEAADPAKPAESRLSGAVAGQNAAARAPHLTEAQTAGASASPVAAPGKAEPRVGQTRPATEAAAEPHVTLRPDVPAAGEAITVSTQNDMRAPARTGSVAPSIPSDVEGPAALQQRPSAPAAQSPVRPVEVHAAAVPTDLPAAVTAPEAAAAESATRAAIAEPHPASASTSPEPGPGPVGRLPEPDADPRMQRSERPVSNSAGAAATSARTPETTPASAHTEPAHVEPPKAAASAAASEPVPRAEAAPRIATAPGVQAASAPEAGSREPVDPPRERGWDFAAAPVPSAGQEVRPALPQTDTARPAREPALIEPPVAAAAASMPDGTAPAPSTPASSETRPPAAPTPDTPDTPVDRPTGAAGAASRPTEPDPTALDGAPHGAAATVAASALQAEPQPVGETPQQSAVTADREPTVTQGANAPALIAQPEENPAAPAEEAPALPSPAVPSPRAAPSADAAPRAAMPVVEAVRHIVQPTQPEPAAPSSAWHRPPEPAASSPAPHGPTLAAAPPPVPQSPAGPSAPPPAATSAARASDAPVAPAVAVPAEGGALPQGTGASGEADRTDRSIAPPRPESPRIEIVSPQRTENVRVVPPAPAAPRDPESASRADAVTTPAAPPAPEAPAAAIPFGSAAHPVPASPLRQIVDAVSAQFPAAPAAPVRAPVAAEAGPLRILTLQLHPADLGTVLVRMRLQDGRLEMNLRTGREDTAERLRREGDALSELLREAGYAPQSVTIEAGGGAGAGSASERGTSQNFSAGPPNGQSGGGAADHPPGRRPAREGHETAALAKEQDHDTPSHARDRGDLYL